MIGLFLHPQPSVSVDCISLILGGWGSSGKKNPGDVSTQALRLIGRKRRKKEETGPKQ